MRRRRPRYVVPDAVRQQLRRRRRVRLGVVSSLLLLSLSVVVHRIGCYGGDDWVNYDRQEVVVTRVIDGDTVRVRRSPMAEEQTVRLLGIDAPELDGGSYWAGESSEQLSRLVLQRTVTTRLDVTETRDRYRRLLAYLYLDDSNNVNLALVRDGHAYAYRTYPHAMRRQFEQAEDEARTKGRGLWAEIAEEQMPQWRRTWLASRRAAGAGR